ncbi:sorbitol dehydrogenase-like isoform X2 [Mercenaria mercenaria]|uniref:sorbitol dehydrogenase-like isoform X2 n=1 Tax=Mercenaria mercenaria TaxID=6596 RepID=UPI00234E49A5|nr:sorbitol dehydrogenase-like isoform X2 [Mercenaria mercenaria]
MADGNLTAILYKKKDLRLESLHIPEPGPGQVQVCIQHVGICGTDLHVYEHGGFGDIDFKEPVGIGHESAGVVSKLGEGVTSLKIGDKVALESIFGCMACSDCKKGNYNLCEDARMCGTPQTWGCLTRYYVHNAADCYKLPDHVSTEEGALMEPLSIAIHSCRRAGVCLGSKVLVLGDGPLGVLTVLTAKASGATQVGITGKHEFRLNIAETVGADFVLNVTSKDPKEVAKIVIDAFGGKPEISIDSTGVQSSIQTAIFATRNGGNVTISGLRENVVSLPIVNAGFREVDIRGVAVNAHCYPIARAMVASGQVNLKPLVTHVFALDQVNEAFKKAETKECMKVMIKCSKD